MPESLPRRLDKGVELLVDEPGEGPAAQKGDHLVYNTRVFLHRGDEVDVNGAQAARIPAQYTRTVDGRTFVDHRIRLGYRECIAGVEVGLFGMQAGGHRRLRIPPHLAYRDRGVPGLIPPNALLEVEVYLREIEPGPGGAAHDAGRPE